MTPLSNPDGNGVGRRASSRVTLGDVARVANVHPSTVSRVLNAAPRSRVPADTAARIQLIARQLGYSPNMMAQGLRTNRTRSVAVVVTDLGNPVIPPIVSGIEQRLGDAGYSVLLGNTDHSRSREQLYLDAVRSKPVDGLISATAVLDDREYLAALQALGMPVVLVNRGLDDESIPAAVPDDFRCSELAVAHLAELGHTRIAHIAGACYTTTGRHRLAGFETAMVRRGLSVDPGMIVASDHYTIAEGLRCCTALLDRKQDCFTAIVAANDMLALGCCDALAARGIPCPDSISVVGCNDMPFVDRCQPALTTVRIPHVQLGRAAADLLLERLEHPERSPHQISIAPRLVVRTSTGPATP